ncbi:MAG: hypothetical protein ABI947_11090 [Chloroflexota bacterium]
MSTTSSELTAELQLLSDAWEWQAREVRPIADAENDPILTARRIGSCDTFEDVAAQIRHRMQRKEHGISPDEDWPALADQWLVLSEWAKKTADTDKNRLTAAYRAGVASAYADASAKLDRALKLTAKND